MEKIKDAISSKIHHNKQPEADLEQDSSFEVLGLMRTRSRQNTGVLSEITRPKIERHISKIPQHDKEEDDDKMPPQLKRNISSIPQDDYDSEDERPPTDAAALNQQHVSDRTGSELEEPGLLRITSDDQNKDAAVPVEQRPGIERHVSMIPDADEPKPNRRAKLERTISRIPTDDYDSDDETAV